MTNNIIFYDGVCAMCNRFVVFILKHDKSKKMQFISLQSEKGYLILKANNILLDTHNLTSIYYFKDNTIKSHSSAILSILIDLGFPWKMIVILKLIPKKIRDIVYQFIAKNRYKFFGKQESCSLLSIEDRKRIHE